MMANDVIMMAISNDVYVDLPTAIKDQLAHRNCFWLLGMWGSTQVDKHHSLSVVFPCQRPRKPIMASRE